MATDPTAVIAAIKRTRVKNEVRKRVSPLMAQYQEWTAGRPVGRDLPRDPYEFLQAQFGPLAPIQAMPLNPPLEGDQRGALRQREMPVGWNMPVGVPGSEGFKLASFGTLRMYADLYSVSRACLQVRKNEIRGLEWDIVPTQEAERAMRGDQKAHRDFAERRAKVVAFFRKPDPDYNKFGSWIDAVCEEMFSIDGLSLYLHPTKKKHGGPFNSDVAALELIAGHTVRPLVNTRGGIPKPPNPAYQQYLYGVPRVDLMTLISGQDEDILKDCKPLEQYRGDQLMYLPYTARSWTPYGFPPLERSIIPTITGLRKQQFQMDFFDEGTIPGNYISPGEQLGWTPNQLEQWQNQQNALAGDPAWKHKSIALPPGSKVFPMRPVELADQFDEIVMTQICMAFDVMPMELGISPRVSTTQSPGAANQMAKASQDTNERKSLKPTLAFLVDIFNTLIQDVWDQKDMRFMFEGLEEDKDETELVSRLVQMIQNGLATIDESRIALGKSPYGLPITSDPVFVSPTAGMVPLGSIDPTTGKPLGIPPPPAVGAPPAPGGGGPPGAPGGPPKPALPPGGQTPPGATPKLGEAKPEPGKAPPGQQAPGPDAPPPPDPKDQAHQDAQAEHQRTIQETHNALREQIHSDFAAGKPVEPPVRPPISDAADTDHHEASTAVKTVDGTVSYSPAAVRAELAALLRHMNKGRNPSTWEYKHVPSWMQAEIAKGAALGTTEFVIATMVEFAADRIRPGSHKAASASDAGPKAGTSTRDWPGWRYDRQLSALYGPLLNGAISGVVDINDLVAGWRQQTNLPIALARGPKPASEGAWSWLSARLFGPLQAAIHRVLTNLWTEGFAVGREAGREMVDSAYNSTFWDNWQPGDAAAAAKVAGDGLQRMLDEYGIPTIKAIAQTRMTQLADALAVGVDQGWSGQQIADSIRPILDNKQRDQMIADTELARATSRASQDAYVEAGQTGKSWATAKDDRVCPECKQNAEEGVIPIAGVFDSGVPAPPAHPGPCRCALLPGHLPADQRPLALKVGPHGYVHGWHFEGVPDAQSHLARSEKSGIRDVQDLTGGKQATTKLVTYNDGSRWVHKDFHQPATAGDRVRGTDDLANSEEAASLVAQAVGARSPVVVRTGRNSVAMPYVSNAGTYKDKPMPSDRHIGLLDGLTANNDRNEGNLLATPDGPVAIDHSETWRHPGGRWEVGSKLASRLQPGDFSKSEMDRIGERLEALRPEFERIFGGTQQHDGTMRAYNLVGRSLVKPATKALKSDGPIAAGLAVHAEETSRVLMIQRAFDENDPAGGQWEFPGGRLDGDETPVEAATREWHEETGLDVPPGKIRLGWTSNDGKYQGYVLDVATEDACPILDRVKGANPDDPDNDETEALAWVDPDHIRDKNPMVRDELIAHPKRVARALKSLGTLGRMAASLHVDARTVYDQLAQNYPPKSIEWVLRARWRGPMLVGWNMIDHDDMDKWAASHQPERVDHFVDKIKAGDDPHPAILVHDPDGNWIDVDGHHRALAYHKLNRPVRSYCGVIDPADRHAMEETHLDQVHEGNDPLNKVGPHGYIHGWHYVGPDKANDVIEAVNASYPGTWREGVKDAKTETVPLADLGSLHDRLDAGTVSNYRSRLQNGEDFDPAVAVKKDGSYYLIDGNHRAAAAAEEGRTHLRVRTINLDTGVANKAAVDGHHVPGTPYTYRHGWHLLDPADRVAAGVTDTRAMHRTGSDYTDERKALHKKIVDDILAGHKPEAHPVAEFLGGGPASGKSSLGESHSGAVIDVDAIRTKLPEYQQMLDNGDSTAAAFTHEESSEISKMAQDEARRRHISYTLDGTGDASYEKMRVKLAQAKAAGYTTRGRYVTVDTDEAVRRANKRAERTGRVVPESFLRETHKNVTSTYHHLINHDDFDETELWDNTGSKPVLVGRKPLGGQWGVENPGAWERFLKKEHEQGAAKAADDGEIAYRLLIAAAGHLPFPADQVPDTAANMLRFAQYQLEVARVPHGAVVDVPHEYVLD